MAASAGQGKGVLKREAWQDMESEEMILLLKRLGQPDEFCKAVAEILNTEYTVDRMIRYLKAASPRRQEDIADEIIAILEDRDRLVRKHIDTHEHRRKEMDDLFIRSFGINWDYEFGFASEYIRGIPAIRNTDDLYFHKNITFFVGENGSGKSTMLEAIAVACKLNPEGGTQNYDFSTYDDYSELKAAVRLRRGIHRPQWSYFLRAESFYNVATAANREYESAVDYHARSHGESFLDFIQDNDSVGLYLMDEPEAALSTQRQMTLLVFLNQMAKRGAQFIIATHSPILLAMPDVEIYSFDDEKIHPIRYEECESYRIMKMFIEDRERILYQLLRDE